MPSIYKSHTEIFALLCVNIERNIPHDKQAKSNHHVRTNEEVSPLYFSTAETGYVATTNNPITGNLRRHRFALIRLLFENESANSEGSH